LTQTVKVGPYDFLSSAAAGTKCSSPTFNATLEVFHDAFAVAFGDRDVKPFHTRGLDLKDVFEVNSRTIRP
jgi:hypothetical protein